MNYLLSKISFAFVILILAIGHSFAVDSSDQKPVIKVGVLAFLSGNSAQVGEEMRSALLLSQEHLKDRKFDYQLIFEDTQMDGNKTALGAQKLIHVDKVDALLSLWATEAAIVTPIAEKAKIIHVTDGWQVSTSAKDKFTLTNWTSYQSEARLLVEELKKRGIHSVSLFSVKQTGYLLFRDEFKRDLAAANIALNNDELFNFGERDFRIAIARANVHRAEINVLNFFPPELNLIAKQMKEADPKVQFTSAEGFDNTDELNLFEGMWYVSSARPTPPIEQELTAKYNQKNFYVSGFAYDSLQLLADGFEGASVNGEKPTSEAVVDWIRNRKSWSGSIGAMTIDDNGVIDSQPVVIEIKNGQRNFL